MNAGQLGENGKALLATFATDVFGMQRNQGCEMRLGDHQHLVVERIGALAQRFDQAARDLVQRNWGERMMKPRRPLRDPKTALQEWAQARGLETPIYREAGRSGPAHAPKFVIEVDVAGYAPTQAEGASKRLAEQAAARAFMAREGVDNRERAGS